jgi:hypothetical protein
MIGGGYILLMVRSEMLWGPEEATSDARPRFEARSIGWEESAVQRAECEQGREAGE